VEVVESGLAVSVIERGGQGRDLSSIKGLGRLLQEVEASARSSFRCGTVGTAFTAAETLSASSKAAGSTAEAEMVVGRWEESAGILMLAKAGGSADVLDLVWISSAACRSFMLMHT
jgi:hypothetical protein